MTAENTWLSKRSNWAVILTESAMNLYFLEAAIIGNREDILQTLASLSDDDKEILVLAKLLLSGNYEEVLKNPFSAEILGTNISISDQDLTTFLKSNIDQTLANLPQDQLYNGSLKLLFVGISCLQLYIQNNWVGPETATAPETFLPQCFRHDTEKQTVKQCAERGLEVDGNAVYSLSRHLTYLLLARTVLVNCASHLTATLTSQWWQIRCLAIHQALLEERSPALKTNVQLLIESVIKKEPLATNYDYKELMTVFYVEATLLMFYYYEPSQAKEYVRTAKKLSQITTELTGVMGKRTRYQTDDKAQLMLQVRKEGSDRDVEAVTDLAKLSLKDQLPVDCALNDDTVLNQVQLKNPEEVNITPVTAEDQAVILASLQEHRKNFEGSGDIIQEESLAFITAILEQRKNWCVLCSALLQRSYWESNSTRRLERTMAQLESLVQQFAEPTSNPANRLYLVTAVKLPPRWEIQRELGHLLMKIGAVKSALDIYLSLQMWEDVIKCYQSLGRKEKAEAVIREQLAIKETPSLYCHLGDVLQDIQYYQKAWELSEGRYSRAQKAMAYYYLYRGKFNESLPCFEKTLSLNSLQIGVWFSYGCAAMACQKYDESAHAFQRCVNINSDNFEAWNNLASVYIKSNQKPRAFVTLQEAIKCDYENWRIWENYLLTAADVGQFDEAIKAYHRVLDLKEKSGQADVLQVLVRAVNEKIEDSNGHSAERLRPKLLELFGRVTSKIASDADIWRLYGELILGGSEITTANQQRAVQYLQKSHRCLTQVVGWEKDIGKCKNIVAHSVKLAKVYIVCVNQIEDNSVVKQLLSSARLMIKGVLSKIKQEHTNPVTQELEAALIEPCLSLETELNTIQDIINCKKDS